MCVSFDNVVNSARCALDFLRIAPTPHVVQFRIGIHTGPLTAGVIGTQRMQYDVWGDTVNVASRMESTSEPGRIHISEALAKALNEALNNALNKPHTVPRGEMEIKGKGLMMTYWLE
jgi:adenylate cyclase